MRAAQLTAWRAPLEITTLPDPDPAPDGVVLRVLACGVCRSDWHAWTGSDPDVALPHVPGHEYCGEVVATGSQVSRWKVGDRVIAPFILACGQCPDCAAGNQTICADQVIPGFTGPGAFAEYVSVDHADANLTALPETMAPGIAAALGCRVTTAWHALTGRAQLRGGEWLAVIGGGVATTAGGVKLLRVYALYLNGLREMERLVHPSSVSGAGRHNRRIQKNGAFIAWVFFMMFALSLALVCVILSALGLNFDQAIVLSIAALSTTGPLIDVAADTPIRLAELGGWAKGVLCATMVLGRLETLAIIALITPDLWRN